MTFKVYILLISTLEATRSRPRDQGTGPLIEWCQYESHKDTRVAEHDGHRRKQVELANNGRLRHRAPQPRTPTTSRPPVAPGETQPRPWISWKQPLRPKARAKAKNTEYPLSSNSVRARRPRAECETTIGLDTAIGIINYSPATGRRAPP